MGSCRNGSITLIFIQLLALVCGIPDLLQPQRTQRAAKLFIKKDDHHVSAFNSDINSFDTLAGIGLGKRDASASSPSFYHYVPPMMSSDYAANMNLFRTSQLLARLRL
uniref:Secreted protein n=1 Tax=Steinernema glaseri TaxID=37863 RepID=A0A1I7XXB5_9BILA